MTSRLGEVDPSWTEPPTESSTGVFFPSTSDSESKPACSRLLDIVVSYVLGYTNQIPQKLIDSPLYHAPTFIVSTVWSTHT